LICCSNSSRDPATNCLSIKPFWNCEADNWAIQLPLFEMLNRNA